MEILQPIFTQMAAVRLPLVGVTVTAVPRSDTPLLLMLHWHGFRPEPSAVGLRYRPVPGSLLQLNERWLTLESIEWGLLDAAWQLGAWDVEREERRACNDAGASAREAFDCRQAFGAHPALDGELLLAEAPDRDELMQLGADAGYVRWQFRPVRGGLWSEVSVDDSLAPDGSRNPPCPVLPQAFRAGCSARTHYRLGYLKRLILR